MIKFNGITNGVALAYRGLKQKAYNITHFAEIDAKKPQIPICLTIKNEDGTYRQATMSADAIRAAHNSAKVSVCAFLIFTPASIIKSIADDISYARELPGKIVHAVSEAKSISKQKETIMWDESIPVPEKFNWVRTSPETPGGLFYEALKANKYMLMKDLQIDSAKYTMLSNVALKIANEESKLGTSTKYQIYNNLENLNCVRDVGSGIRKIKEGDGTLSLGLTQLKIDNLSKEEKELFDKYGITYGNNRSNINRPTKSAVATIIHLAHLDKDYAEYLRTVRANKLDTADVNVQQSIKNAQRIIFNNFKYSKNYTLTTKEAALGALTSVNGSNAEKEFLYDAAISAKDLEDLRIYAQTVELSEPAYLAARWNGRRVLPFGDKKDIACENIINLITQKGYIANIDNTSEIYY